MEGYVRLYIFSRDMRQDGHDIIRTNVRSAASVLKETTQLAPDVGGIGPEDLEYART